MSLPAELCEGTLSRIADRCALTELPSQELTSTLSGQPAGHLRVLHGTGVSKLVQVTLTVQEIGLDSHMLFAFTPADAAVPHFTLDAVGAGGGYAFHLDLIPRVNLANAPEHVARVYEPLDQYSQVRELPGMTPADLNNRQLACMSPWMLAHRTDERAFRRVGSAVAGYLEHWLELVGSGDASAAADAEALVEHDRAQRAELFSPEVDPVWAQVEMLVGDQARTIREELLTNSLVRGT